MTVIVVARHEGMLGCMTRKAVEGCGRLYSQAIGLRQWAGRYSPFGAQGAPALACDVGTLKYMAPEVPQGLGSALVALLVHKQAGSRGVRAG